MPAVDPVILQLRADVAQYRNELRSTTTLVDQSLARQERAAQRLEATMESSFGAIGRTIGRFTSAITSIGGIAAARALLEIADTAKSINAQLSLATASFGTFNQAQSDTRRIAAETRSSLEATTALYGGFIRSAQETGRTQEQASRATETFAKALKIGGAGANEAASATLQFNQALQSGVLRGDEFNSIMEASPRIARLLAESLDVPIGQLRKMAEEGKLTSDVLYRALTDRRFTAGIDEEFQRLPVTFSEAMTRITNAAVITFGAFDRGGEFSTALANFISDGTDGFESLERKAEESGIEMRATFAALSNIFDPLLKGAQSSFAGIRDEANYTRDSIANILRLIDNVDNFLIGLQNRATSFDNSIKSGLNRAIDRAGGGQHFSINPLTPYANRAGTFTSAFDNDQAARRGNAQARRIAGSLPGYANFTSPGALQAYLRGDYLKPRTSTTTAPTSGGSGGRKARSGATGEIDETAKLIAAIRSDMGRLNIDLGRVILTETERMAAAAHAFSDVFGNQPDKVNDLVEEYERTTRAEVEARGEAEARIQDIRFQNIRDLANFYEDAFLNGTGSIFDNFKRTGLRVIAQLLAQWTAAQAAKGGIGGGIAGFLGSVASIAGGGGIPRFANGGAMMLGGRGGVDQNTLSLNGAPIARVSRGEAMTISPNARAARGGGTTVVHQHFTLDARQGIMTPDLIRGVQSYVDGAGRDAVRTATNISRKSLPAAQQRFGKLGTT